MVHALLLCCLFFEFPFDLRLIALFDSFILRVEVSYACWAQSTRIAKFMKEQGMTFACRYPLSKLYLEHPDFDEFIHV